MGRLAIIIVLLLSLFGIADLFRPGYYSSHDGTGHVIRMQEFYRALEDGHFPVRWSQNLYWGYGYPFFNFNYPLVYYVGAGFIKLGLEATDAMKAETIASFVISGILMYAYLRRHVKEPYAILGSILYMYAPYRLLNIYIRGSVAEAVAFVFPPLLLWAVEELKNKRSILWSSLLFGLLGLSHNISALLLTGFFFSYLLIFRDPKRFVRGVIAFTLGVLMAAFFIFPALYEKQWTFLDLTIAKDYPGYFVGWRHLIDPQWGLGWVQIGLFFLSLKFFKKTSLFVFGVLMTLISVFFMLPVSKPLWDRLPLLPFVQFPWRFTMLALPALVISGTLGIDRLPKKIVLVLGILILAISAPFWSRYQTETVPSITHAIEGSTTWAHEQATRWLAPKPDRIPLDKIENADYQIISWKTHEHKYNIFGSGVITENTMYYPGWKVFVDGVETEINYANGKINYLVLPGEHQIKTVFTETPMRQTLDILSLGTFGLVVLGLLFSYVVPQVFAKH